MKKKVEQIEKLSWQTLLVIFSIAIIGFAIVIWGMGVFAGCPARMGC